jgi:hypothetical protein
VTTSSETLELQVLFIAFLSVVQAACAPEEEQTKLRELTKKFALYNEGNKHKSIKELLNDPNITDEDLQLLLNCGNTCLKLQENMGTYEIEALVNVMIKINNFRVERDGAGYLLRRKDNGDN